MKVTLLIILGLLVEIAVAQEAQIVGGVAASGPIPYQAGIQQVGTFVCGGTLVNRNWIVSAAHCQSPYHLLYSKIVLGAYSATDTAEATRQTIGIAQQIVHADYNSTSFSADVMVMKLATKAVRNYNVRPAILPDASRSKSYPAVNTDVTVSGWGRLQNAGASPSKLMKVVVNVVDHASCVARYGSRNLLIDDGMLCLAKAGKDACQGDSGGPAVVHRGFENELVGVVSWGLDCASPRFPGVYARVTYYADWIREKIANKALAK